MGANAFHIDSSKLVGGLAKGQAKAVAAIMMYAQTKAQELEYKMKHNRPWTDRTGMAKARLNAKVSQPSSNMVRITLAHGVEYGMWLEFAHGKNYAIIKPTIDQEAPSVINDMGDLMSKIF